MLQRLLAALLLVVCGSAGAESGGGSGAPRLEEVEVQGEAALGQAGRAESVTVIGVEESSEKPPSVLNDLLLRAPSVHVTQTQALGFGVGPSAAGGIRLRGLGGSPATDVLVLVDGRPDFNGMFGHPTADAYALGGIDRVEIIRGPSSVLYGSNAFGGVINMIAREPRPGVLFAGSTSAGSFGTSENQVRGSYASEGGYISVDGNFRRTDGHRKDSAFEGLNFDVRAKRPMAASWSLGGSLSLARFDFENPGPLGGLPGVGGRVVRSAGDVVLDSRPGPLTGSTRFYLAYGKNRLDDGFRGYDTEWGLLEKHSFEPMPGAVLTLGVDLVSFGGNARNVKRGVSFGRNTITEIGPYVFARWSPWRWVKLTSGMRYTYNDRFGDIVLPEAGVVFQPHPTTALRLRVARGYRAPTVRELFLFPAPNKNLRPQKLWQVEAGMNQQIGGRLTVDLAGFYQTGGNLIRTFFDPTIDALRLDNGGSFVHRGLESSVEVAISDSLALRVATSTLDLEGDTALNPLNMVDLSLVSTPGSFSFRLTGRYVHRLFGQDDHRGRLPDFFVADMEGSYRISEACKLFVRVSNVTDKDYETVPGFPLPGLAAYAGISFHEG